MSRLWACHGSIVVGGGDQASDDGCVTVAEVADEARMCAAAAGGAGYGHGSTTGGRGAFVAVFCAVLVGVGDEAWCVLLLCARAAGC